LSEDIEPRTKPSSTRRRFLNWLVRGFLGLWGVGFVGVITAFVGAPRSPRSLAERVLKVGTLESLPVGTAKLVQHGREPVWVVRTEEDVLVGLSAVCTHVRCILTWDGDQQILNCPCHDGAFDLNGNVLSGPPPRALQRYQVETQLGQIYVRL
jgi:Rieske Fe-S protein